MKQLIFAMVMMMGISFGVNAQAPVKEKPKKHVCTEACHKQGKHVYAHGEKGHVCTDECKKMKS